MAGEPTIVAEKVSFKPIEQDINAAVRAAGEADADIAKIAKDLAVKFRKREAQLVQTKTPDAVSYTHLTLPTSG